MVKQSAHLSEPLQFAVVGSPSQRRHVGYQHIRPTGAETALPHLRQPVVRRQAAPTSDDSTHDRAAVPHATNDLFDRHAVTGGGLAGKSRSGNGPNSAWCRFQFIAATYYDL